MSTVLKTFRLPQSFARFLEQRAKKLGVSQTKILEEYLKKAMVEEEQWEKDLQLIADDKKYREEQINLAEEAYEEFED